MSETTSASSSSSKDLVLDKSRRLPDLFGPQDAHLKLIEKKFNVRITTRDNQVRVQGDLAATETVADLLAQLDALLSEDDLLVNGDVKFAIRLMSEDPRANLKAIFSQRVYVSPKRGYITPRGVAQKQFIQSINQHDIVLGIGPAGTGKTYLAVVLAVEGLLKHKFDRIILVRPAVEAGEKLGFLPGDISEKINPYLMPLYDALYDLMEFNRVQELIQEGVIEIAPLAYMRGRTLNNSFIILDEAQNSTQEQMKMFLTRLGFRSKMVVTGDVTQVDLPREKRSGLIHVKHILKDVEGIKFIEFTDKDVVRHDLVKEIVRAYDQNE